MVNGVMNLLVVGSVVGGKDAQAAVVEAAAWSAALLIGSGVLASIGGAIARRTPARDGLLPPPISLVRHGRGKHHLPAAGHGADW